MYEPLRLPRFIGEAKRSKPAPDNYREAMAYTVLATGILFFNFLIDI